MAQAVRYVWTQHAANRCMDMIGDVLNLVEQYMYQGSNKTRKKYLQRLDSTGYSDTAIPYDVAEPMIGTAARAIDRLEALLGQSEGRKVGVNVTNTGYCRKTNSCLRVHRWDRV